ncbi:hypothetical protein ACQY0O_003981 [Thecaphora frezii]
MRRPACSLAFCISVFRLTPQPVSRIERVRPPRAGTSQDGSSRFTLLGRQSTIHRGGWDEEAPAADLRSALISQRAKKKTREGRLRISPLSSASLLPKYPPQIPPHQHSRSILEGLNDGAMEAKRDPDSPSPPAGTKKRAAKKPRTNDGPKAVWGGEHDEELRRAVLQSVYNNRSNLHKGIVLLDPFREKGASKITSKLNTLISKLEREWGVTVNKNSLGPKCKE